MKIITEKFDPFPSKVAKSHEVIPKEITEYKLLTESKVFKLLSHTEFRSFQSDESTSIDPLKTGSWNPLLY